MDVRCKPLITLTVGICSFFVLFVHDIHMYDLCYFCFRKEMGGGGRNLTIIYNLTVCLYVYLLSPLRHFGLQGLNFQGVIGLPWGGLRQVW